MFDDLVNKIKIICSETRDCDEIYENIINILKSYNPNFLNEIIENEIDFNYENIKIITVNEDTNPYYKYYLYNSRLFDIIHIKWTKNSETKIHDNPKLGCFTFVINDGKLYEHIYTNSYIFKKLLRNASHKLTYNKIAYINGNINLNKFCAHEYTETIHICIPGNYRTKYYN